MNRIYKIVWSKAKNAYVVTSEVARSHTKSASGKAMKVALTAFLLTGISVSPVSAAIDGVTKFVEPGNQNIKIGNGTELRNNSTKNGAIAIGDHAQIDDYVMQEGSIAIGKNAFVENMWGTQDKLFRFGMTATDPSRTDHLLPAGIAIGQNTYARSGGVMIGDHKYVGALGDITVDSNTDSGKRKRSVLVGATTVGLNSYSAGAFATTTGAYSIMTNAYDGDTNQGSAAQNFGAVINGSFNSIESKTANSNVSGIANAVVGTANRTHNANGTLVFGAGNEVTNSVDNIANPMSLLANSPKELAEKLREDIRRNDSGGAVLAVGGGNKADYAYRSQMIGVGNTLKGTTAEKAAYNLLNGYKNTVTKAEHVSVIGSENTVENSKSQTVIGDSNKITDRNAGTVSGKQEERTKNVSDLVIGKGNKIEGNSTYMKGYESLTVIGNNNEMVNPGAGIVIGDNQKVGAIKESVVIGSMTPEEKADSDIQQKHASVVVGYHAQSGTRDGGGMNVALGHGAKAYGWQETVTGIKSIVEAGDSGLDGYLASVYGGLNTVASNKADQNDGMANTVVGTLNKTEGANGALVFGAGNSVTHSFGTAPTDEDGNSMNDHWSDAILGGGQRYAIGEGPLGHDEIRKAMGLAMSTGGGSVVTMGNGNTSDYAVHSQIIGSGNILTGTANTPSINNTINGYGNTGRNVERMSMMGTGNNMSGSTADVVIGDYHHMDGGKNNVILGSMATEKKTVEKTYTRKDASGNVILEKKYKVMENVPIKSHTANISNAVMLGYNTDVEKDGGVALGADSIASVDKGVKGYDPAAGNHANDTTGTWKATAAAVSVGKAADPTGAAGSPAITRQITNVAAGTQDTDAVNVAQLKAVQTAADASKVHYYSVNDKGYHVGNYNNDGAKGGMALAAGAGAAANGTASTVTGAFSRVDGDGVNGFTNGFQGATSSVYGTFNVVGAKNGVKFDGVANSIVGVANKTENANAALIFGAGNKVTNSYRPVTGSVSTLSQAMQKALNTGDNSDMITALGEMTKTSGGAVLAIGGANTADYAQLSKLVGVGNTLTGTNGHESLYNMIDGYLNTGKNVNHVSVIGSENTVTNGNSNIVIGDKHKLTGVSNSVVLGSADSETEQTVSEAVSVGHNAKVEKAGGVALGSSSVASVDKGIAGYDPKTGSASSDASSTWKATQAAVSVGDAANNVTRQITGVAAGAQDTDAVNVAQLKQVQSTATTAANMEVKGGDNVTVDKTTAGPDNHTVYTVNSKDTYTTGGTYDAATKKLKFTQNDPSKNYEVDVSGLVGAGGSGNLTFAGDSGSPVTKNSGETLNITGGVSEADTASANNIGVIAKDGKLNLKLAKNIDLGSDGSVKTGNTRVSNTGVTIAGGPSMTTAGIDAGGKKITSVAAGEVSSTSTDAVNGSQLHAVKNDVQNITNNVTNISGKVNKLDNRLDRVGAGAAALAALHPLDFDPDDKWDFAAGYGNYRGANAVSVGAFYRPNEDTMFSVGGSFGGGENMVNAGLSLKLGQGNHVSTSKVAMAKEIEELHNIVKKQAAQIDRLEAMVAPGMAGTAVRDVNFPDVPQDHWAYRYVKSLADRGLVEGYPDGEFKGDRSMTRYEFAAIIYRALQNGAPIDADMGKAMNEFGPELEQVHKAERFRVDRISGKDNDRHKVERVRVNNKDNKAENDYRDVYGSHIPAKG